MALHDICLGCGHKKHEHVYSHCNNDQCTCTKFKELTLGEQSVNT
jgi:hypothetical protein